MKTGIIGFFDVLGYKSFLQNNTDDTVSLIVSKLVNLNKTLPNQMVEAFSHYQTRDKATEIVKLVNWLVFSDTIMLYTEFGDHEPPKDRSNRWIAMHFACLLLWRRMFEFGLPIRGIIHTGDFHVQGNCFAGKAIVQAYEEAQDFDLSIAAYSDEAFNSLVNHANNTQDNLLWNWIPTQLFEYLIPRKSMIGKRSYVINPITIHLEDSKRFCDDGIRQLVTESFLDHNKDIAATAKGKANHTEEYLRNSLFKIKQGNISAERMLQRKTY